MEKNLYIDASHPNETRVVLKNENHIEDYEYESINNTLIKIYLSWEGKPYRTIFTGCFLLILEEKDTDFYHSMISNQITIKYLKAT